MPKVTRVHDFRTPLFSCAGATGTEAAGKAPTDDKKVIVDVVHFYLFLPLYFFVKETLIKRILGNAQLFRLARRKLFFEAGVNSSALDCLKKVKQRRQTEYISVSLKTVSMVASRLPAYPPARL